ncbi:MAG TPA: sensor domain-containing diguanylate cyclase [Frankiaceae bacterium]|nr:sensor domain-containing diguanylate cyclase [Frankiaceae bacterium]
MTSLQEAPSPTEDPLREPPSDLERLVRPLLELMQRITGLETTFLTQIDWVAQQQTVSFALNASELEVAEGSTVDWSDSMCRWSLLTGKDHTDRVPDDFPDSVGAVAVGMQTFFAIPVLDLRDQVIGTVCGASRRSVELSEADMATMNLIAQATACQLELAGAGTAARQRAEHAELLAVTDPLTGLANRRGFMARYEEEQARSSRHDYPVALLLIDIDFLKSINDTFGHSAGDRVLQVLATAMSESCRAEDIPGRLGGDEFALALTHADQYGAESVAHRIALDFAAATAALDMPATLSVGISDSDRTPRRSMQLGADEALYRSKELGRDRAETWAGEHPDAGPG